MIWLAAIKWHGNDLMIHFAPFFILIGIEGDINIENVKFFLDMDNVD